MDAIRYMLGFLWRFAVGLLLLSCVLWVIGTLYPALSFRSLVGQAGLDGNGEDWLPAPGSYSGVFGNQKRSKTNGTVYKHGPAFDGYKNGGGGASVSYVSYTSSGEETNYYGSAAAVEAKKNISASSTAEKILYIRNLSIYERGHVYTGLSFMGEARETMFVNGRFPIVIVDQSGKPVASSYAEATTDWSPAGWSRFRVLITSVLPNNIPCAMLFQQAQQPYRGYSYGGTPPQRVQIAFPIMCN